MSKVAIPKAYLYVEHRDKNGKVLHIINRESHSWVDNYYNWLTSITMGYDSTATNSSRLVDYGGTTRGSNEIPQSGPHAAGYQIWVDNTSSPPSGVVIGTGTDAEDCTDYYLSSVVDDGTDSGKMEYSANTLTYALVGTTHKNTIGRTFSNNSGGSITVIEYGLVGILRMAFGLGAYLLNRDKELHGIAISNGETIYVAYTIQLTFPE